MDPFAHFVVRRNTHGEGIIVIGGRPRSWFRLIFRPVGVADNSGSPRGHRRSTRTNANFKAIALTKAHTTSRKVDLNIAARTALAALGSLRGGKETNGEENERQKQSYLHNFDFTSIHGPSH